MSARLGQRIAHDVLVGVLVTLIVQTITAPPKPAAKQLKE